MNIILTGIPRSGTTLACHLLNKLPDVVALNEPMNMGTLLRATNQDEIIEEVEHFFATQRASLLASRTAMSKSVGGTITSNMFDSSTKDPSGLRISLANYGKIVLNKRLSTNFQLIIKHPNAFSSLLPCLAQRWRCFAVIRNPVAILLSWNSIQAKFRLGHAPMAEAFDAELKQRLLEEPEPIQRQLILIEWFFTQYHQYLPTECIIRYEDIIMTRGKCLDRISAKAKVLDQNLENENRSKVVSKKMSRILEKTLLNRQSDIWSFYRREDIVDLLKVQGEKA